MKIQKWLLPNKANKYHPHLLRPLGLGLVVVALLGINLTQNLASAHSFQVLGVATNISSSDVISLSNQERANNGLGALSYNAKLTAAAEAKARDMFAKDYWAHNAPDGTTPWHFMTAAGYDYATAGENLAKNFDTSSGVVQGWMNSAGHRANILNSTYRDTGIAVMDGTLQGESTTLVVAMYGSLKTAPTAPATPVKTTPTASKAAPVTSRPSTVTAKPADPAPAATPTSANPVEPTPIAATPPEITATEVAPVAPKPSPQVFKTQALQAQSVSIKQSRTWAQNATLFIICTLFLVNVLKHTAVWRLKKHGLRHVWLRAHPAAQYGILLVAIISNLAAGVGVVR